MNVTEFVFRNVSKFADKIAIVDGPADKHITHNELWKTVRRTAAGLQKRGLKKEDVVAVWSPNNSGYVIAFHGTICAGGTVTTLNPIYTAHEVAYQLENAGAKILVCDPAFLPRVFDARKTYSGLEEVFVLGDKTVEGCAPFASVEVDAEPIRVTINAKEDVVVLPYSSGTTGLPKGVMLTHYNIIANLCQLNGPSVSGLSSADTLLAVLPFYHIYGMVVIMNLGILLGAKIVTIPAFEPELYMKLLTRHGVTVAHVAPPLVQFLAKSPQVDAYLPFPKLRQLFSGAAPLGPELSIQAKQRLGAHVEMSQGYGMTEMSPVSHLDGPSGAKLGSIGLLAPSMECKIVNPDTGELQPAGTEEQRGELWLRGPNVMKGYHRNEEATRSSIDADGFLHTGDIGFVDSDGVYYIVDRLKELIKAKGFQVAPAELEALLVKHPDVADAAVIGAPAEKYGGREGDGEVPKAFVLLQPGAKLTQAQLSDWLAPQVTIYKRVNANAIDFVESIPKSASGKILRKDLREIEKKLPPKAKL
jgi:acyl-CoA synthetase (AMP-forming)/AMP-acid ligase II